MEIIKFDRIVSVNSEVQVTGDFCEDPNELSAGDPHPHDIQIPGHGVQNILNGEISPNKNWMCEKGTEKAVAILQLERAVVLTSIHVGNAHSAFVEILVGKAADNSDQFESLIPMSVFMNPHESKTGTNPNRTRFFNKADFNEATAMKSWDRIKVVCSQPFNKYVPYGLCFLKVHGEKKVKKTEVFQKDDDKDEIQVGSFFKKKRNSGGDKPLTVGEQIKEAEKETPFPLKKPKLSDDEKREQQKKSGDRTPKRAKGKKEEDQLLKKSTEKILQVEKISERREEEKRVSEKKRRKKFFEKLMEDVVLVISGFKNPLRGNIRSMALEMGARYSADWEPHCTHLVCAYENTPKFHQIKGKGKIVKKEWVEMCYKNRKRYPWRRFALDKADLKKTESEEEFDAVEESESDEQAASSSKIEPRVHERVAGSNPKKTKSGDDDYDQVTDDEEENIIDTTDYPMPHLPDVFSLKIFYVDPNLQNKATLERYIIAYNGVLTDTFHKDVDFYITDVGGAPVELFRKKAPNLVAIKPSWIWEINSKQNCVSTIPHLIE